MDLFRKFISNFDSERFEEVNNARIHDIVAPEVERWLVPLGFEAVGTLKWVRDRYVPMRHVFGFGKWKGGVLAPRWGVSLDFVPHLSGQQIRWHRSNKTADFDLRVERHDQTLDMTYFSGERPIRNMHSDVIARAVQQAEGFWARCETVDDLPDAVEWLKDSLSSQDLSFYGYIQHNLAAPFILAKTGHYQEALAELERGYLSAFKGEDVMQKLKDLIATEKP